MELTVIFDLCRIQEGFGDTIDQRRSRFAVNTFDRT